MLDYAAELRDEVEFLCEASNPFIKNDYLAGKLTPVHFGSDILNFGVQEMLDGFVTEAPAPLSHETVGRVVAADECNLDVFVFKIQANMNSKRRDR